MVFAGEARKHVILTKNPIFEYKIQKILQKYLKFLGFLGTPVETSVETPEEKTIFLQII